MSEQLKISAAEAAHKPTGKVVGIIKRNWRPFCGMLNVSQIKEVSLESLFQNLRFLNCKLSSTSLFLTLSTDRFFLLLFFLYQSTRHLFTPADRQIPRIRIETRQASALAGQRIMVAIDGWPKHSRYPNVRTSSNLNILHNTNCFTGNGIVHVFYFYMKPHFSSMICSNMHEDREKLFCFFSHC